MTPRGKMAKTKYTLKDRVNSGEWLLSRVPVCSLPIEKLPELKAAAKLMGLPYKIVYRGPRPNRKASCTLKKHATHAEIYVYIPVQLTDEARGRILALREAQWAANEAKWAKLGLA